MCKHDGKEIKGDEDMIKDKVSQYQDEKLSREELRKKLIQETIKENHEALKQLSRT